MPVTAPSQIQGATQTINIVTLVMPTRIALETLIPGEIDQTEEPDPTASSEMTVDRPLLIPHILRIDYGVQSTRLVVGLDIHPAQRHKPGVRGEIYDAVLHDQTGKEIPGISIEMSQPDQVTLEFAPLPAGSTNLNLRAQLALRGVPSQAPLVIDVSNHPLDQTWPIEHKVPFGDLNVQLTTARLSRQEIGASPDAKQQVELELNGENADFHGAQLICLVLSPLPPPTEGSMGCGQEPGGIQASVSLGPVVGRSAPLPMPSGLVTLNTAADFLLPGYWETSWLVER